MNRWSPNNNPRVRRRQLLRWKNALNHDYKTTVVVIFNLQNSHLLTLSLPTQEVFQVNGQNHQWQIFQLSIFILSQEKC